MNIIDFPRSAQPHRETWREIFRRWAGRLLRFACAMSFASAPFTLPFLELSPITLIRNDNTQHLEIPLGRHSVVVLNRHSALTTWRQGDKLYAVVHRGEIIFDIKEQLGLVVQASGVTIQDLGTVFSVQINSSQVKITLSEGALAVSGNQFQHMVLHDRQQVIVSASDSIPEHDPEIKSISLQALGAEWAWREDIPEVQCTTTLGLLALQFNQRNADKLVVPDALAPLPLSITGGFPLDKTSAVLTLLTDVDSRIKVESTAQNGRTVVTVHASPGVVKSLLENSSAKSICRGWP